MTLFRHSLLAAAFLIPMTGLASAHAMLQSASPPVGGTVAASPQELRLTFSEGVVPALSHVAIRAQSGAPVPLGKLAVAPGNPAILIAHLARPLQPGSYSVDWRAVSVDTHHTQGSFNFTVR